ncbi:MAG: hypothetical protein E6772_07475 [Dysgonomonas sp.]|nr:hypothetical protein [Dysgonomonas sp.]
MRKITEYGILILLAPIVVSCKDVKSSEKQVEVADTVIVEDVFVWPDSIENIFHIPDSIVANDSIMNDTTWRIRNIWTPEQKDLAKLVMKTFVENVEVVDDHLKFVISRDEFVALGIPEPYYDMLLQSLKNLNDARDTGFSWGSKTIADIWGEVKDNINKEFLIKK